MLALVQDAAESVAYSHVQFADVGAAGSRFGRGVVVRSGPSDRCGRWRTRRRRVVPSLCGPQSLQRKAQYPHSYCGSGVVADVAFKGDNNQHKVEATSRVVSAETAQDVPGCQHAA